MFTSKFFKNKPASTHLNRLLHLHAKPRDEIMIANNSGIFFTLSSLREHPLNAHPSLKIIMPEFWIDKTHPVHDNLDWGQTSWGLPWHTRKEFLTINPSQPDNKPINWKQFKDFRKHVITEIKKFPNVELLTGTPTIINKGENYEIKTNEKTFRVPKTAYFYNSFRVPDLEHNLDIGMAYKLPRKSHVELYYLDPSKIPQKACILGGGRSVKWAAEHHSKTYFFWIKDNENTLDLSYLKNIDEHKLYEFDPQTGKYKILPDLDNQENIFIVNKDYPAVKEAEFLGELYCAIGFKPLTEITQMIPSSNLLLYPYPNNLKWIAPKDLPVGSLIEATLRWANVTNNLSWAYETFSYHTEPFNNFIKILEDKGIPTFFEFFDTLRDKLTELNTAPDLRSTIELYKESYKISFNMKYKKEVPNELLEKIENVLRNIEESRMNHPTMK